MTPTPKRGEDTVRNDSYRPAPLMSTDAKVSHKMPANHTQQHTERITHCDRGGSCQGSTQDSKSITMIHRTLQE